MGFKFQVTSCQFIENSKCVEIVLSCSFVINCKLIIDNLHLKLTTNDYSLTTNLLTIRDIQLNYIIE